MSWILFCLFFNHDLIWLLKNRTWCTPALPKRGQDTRRRGWCRVPTPISWTSSALVRAAVGIFFFSISADAITFVWLIFFFNDSPGCYRIATIFSHAQTVVPCTGCSLILCQPRGGKCRLTEGEMESHSWKLKGEVFMWFRSLKWVIHMDYFPQGVPSEESTPKQTCPKVKGSTAVPGSERRTPWFWNVGYPTKINLNPYRASHVLRLDPVCISDWYKALKDV